MSLDSRRWSAHVVSSRPISGVSTCLFLSSVRVGGSFFWVFSSKFGSRRPSCLPCAAMAQLHMSSINAARSQRLAQANSGRQTEFIAFGELSFFFPPTLDSISWGSNCKFPWLWLVNLAASRRSEWVRCKSSSRTSFCFSMFACRSARADSVVARRSLPSCCAFRYVVINGQVRLGLLALVESNRIDVMALALLSFAVDRWFGSRPPDSQHFVTFSSICRLVTRRPLTFVFLRLALARRDDEDSDKLRHEQHFAGQPAGAPSSVRQP